MTVFFCVCVRMKEEVFVSAPDVILITIIMVISFIIKRNFSCCFLYCEGQNSWSATEGSGSRFQLLTQGLEPGSSSASSHMLQHHFPFKRKPYFGLATLGHRMWS